MQNIQFIESSHKYFVDGEEYISATTLIEKYVPEFEEQYWSQYKAIERIFKKRYGDSKGQEYFKELKSQRSMHSPGWIDWMCTVELISQETLEQVQQELLKEWKKENEDSLKKGSEYHALRETQAYQLGYAENPFTSKKHGTVKRKSTGKKINLQNLGPGYYPEIIIWNNEYKIIGTADRVFISMGKGKNPRKQVWVDDYKTNKAIVKQNPYENMKYPLERLQNCNYSHYRLQLGLYAWMMEQYGYEIKGISINHEGVQMKMQYRAIRPMILKMINHYSGNDLNLLPKAGKYGFSDVHLFS